VIEPLARNPAAQARLLAGEGARVLEPSPPAVTAPPWFADDPTGGEPLDWSARSEVAAGWREERWLGPYPRLAALPESFAATRDALHALAERELTLRG
jgi:hypothetical protein